MTIEELNAAGKAAVEKTQESKREATREYWAETGEAAEILERWRAQQPIRVTLEPAPDPAPYPEIVRMNSKQYVLRSHALSIIEGFIMGALTITLIVMLVAIGGLFA